MASNDAEGKIADDEKIFIAAKYKQEGNELYKRKDFRKAIGKYHRSLLYLKAIGENNKLQSMLGQPVTELDPKIVEKCDSLKVDIYNNLSVCLLQQESPNYEKVCEYCDMVLEKDSLNVKARHRKAVALYHLQKFEESLDILQQLDQTDSANKRYISLCKVGLQKEEKELKNAYKNMFSS